MQHRLIWRTNDGLIHRATLVGNQDDGPTVRSNCGLVANPYHEDLTDEPVQITCLRCLRIGGSNGQVHTPGENASESRAHRDPPRESSNGPKLLGDILKEMGPPTREQDAPESTGTVSQDYDLIYSYSRSEALRDGTLIDVTATANEAGLRYPTALTRAVWEQFVQVPEGVIGQDEAGRLWDILYLLQCAIQRSPSHTDSVHFYLHVRNDNSGTKRFLLKAVCGPDDNRSPCLTVMLPEED